MTHDQARKLVGNQPETCVRNMALALSLLTWRNTADDWQRLEAACLVLGRKAPKRARDCLANHARLVRGGLA